MNSTKVQNPRRYVGAHMCIKGAAQIYQEYTAHTKNMHHTDNNIIIDGLGRAPLCRHAARHLITVNNSIS